jgi:hypothetical protein
MANPLTGPLIAWASGLRHPTLFKITAGLLLLNLVLPDPVPFLDEIAMALATMVLANWKRPAAPAEPARAPATIEGESRRE